MPPIQATQGQSVFIRITANDDQMIGFLNDAEIFNIAFGGVPNPGGLVVQLGNQLRLGENFLHIIGVNTGGPWVFGYELNVAGTPAPGFPLNDAGDSTRVGIVHRNSIIISVTP